MPSCRPDLPEIKEEIKNGAQLTSEIELLFKLAPCKIVAVTGSDGKTTTTTLIYNILKEKYNCYLGGNLGNPLFTKIDEMQPNDIIVLELSSFQLMTMKQSPDIAVITNITPNHLDIHKSYQEYIEAKENIFKYQKENELFSNMDADTRNIMLGLLEESMGKDKTIFVINHAEMNDDYFAHKVRVGLIQKNDCFFLFDQIKYFKIIFIQRNGRIYDI